MSDLTPEQRIARLRAQRGQAPVQPTPRAPAPRAPLPPPSAAHMVVGVAPPSAPPVPGVVEATPNPASVSFVARLNELVATYSPRAHPARRARRATAIAAGVGFLAMLPMMGPLTAAQADQQPDGDSNLDDATLAGSGIPGSVPTAVAPVVTVDPSAVPTSSSPDQALAGSVPLDPSQTSIDPWSTDPVHERTAVPQDSTSTTTAEQQAETAAATAASPSATPAPAAPAPAAPAPAAPAPVAPAAPAPAAPAPAPAAPAPAAPAPTNPPAAAPAPTNPPAAAPAPTNPPAAAPPPATTVAPAPPPPPATTTPPPPPPPPPPSTNPSGG